MRIIRTGTTLLAVLLAAASFGQAWIKSYDAALASAKVGKWMEARQEFQQAAANRAEDISAPTVLPGPPTEQRRWRKGSAYSPNFLAAYSAYRAGLDSKDPAEQTADLKTAASEFETLLAKGQQSRETYFFLSLVYTRLGDETKRQALADRLSKTSKLDWKVDDEIVAPEELAAMSIPGGQNGTPGTPPSSRNDVVKAGENTTGTTGQTLNSIVPGLGIGAVPTVPTKYALVVGQVNSRLSGGLIPFAAEDARRVRESLIGYAGYSDANVLLVENATAQQLQASAKALASRVPEDATVLIYYCGAAVNLAGRDFLAGADTESTSDTSTMLGKTDLFSLFTSRGARVFAFFETNRPIVNGFFFGSEVPPSGSIAQAQATLPDEGVTSTVRNGKVVGVYADAFASVLTELRSSKIPINEFGWQVFSKTRRGNTGTTGGGSRQTPTLPTLSNMAADARF